VWHCPGDAAKWQELHRYASPRLQPALEKRCLQLGHRRSSARLYQQGQIPGSESPRSRPRPRVAVGRRSVALRRLHHAGKGNSVRPFIRGDEERSCVIRAHCAGDELHHLLSRLSVEMIGRQRRPGGRSCQGRQPPKAGAMASLNRPAAPGPHSAARHRRVIHITRPCTRNGPEKSREVYEKSTCKKVGSPDPKLLHRRELPRRARTGHGRPVQGSEFRDRTEFCQTRRTQ